MVLKWFNYYIITLIAFSHISITASLLCQEFYWTVSSSVKEDCWLDISSSYIFEVRLIFILSYFFSFNYFFKSFFIFNIYTSFFKTLCSSVKIRKKRREMVYTYNLDRNCIIVLHRDINTFQSMANQCAMRFGFGSACNSSTLEPEPTRAPAGRQECRCLRLNWVLHNYIHNRDREGNSVN